MRSLRRLIPDSMASRIRDWRVRHLIGRVVEHTYGTSRLKVYLADSLAQAWYDNDWPELPEIAALRETRLVPGATVFDAGAHQGVVAMMIAREVGSTGLVVAVDPGPLNISTAQRNRDLNEMHQIQLVQAAVSDRQGTVIFNDGQNGNGQLDSGTKSGGQFVVESITIDDLADRFGMPDVVFVDVEGAESLALSGASRVIASGADFFIEVHAGNGLEKLGGSVDQVLSHFPEERFSVLIRGETETCFRPLHMPDPSTENRFFLIARVR